MPVKKSSHQNSPKSDIQVDHLPDVFDEDASSNEIVPRVQSAANSVNLQFQVKEEVEPELSKPTEENDLPLPSAPPAFKETLAPILPPMPSEPITSSELLVSDVVDESLPPIPEINKAEAVVEKKLPSFFVEVPAVETPVQEVQNVVPVPESVNMSAFEALVPQAFVGEARAVTKEVKREKKGAIVTFFIILGMILVAAGVVGFYIYTMKKSSPSVAPTPAPTPIVEATPVPTPTIIVNTATTSAQPAVGSTATLTKLKLNVLNGTTTKGLAAKEASVLKKAGYTIGDVGNGTPSLAGTISVPTGKTDVATGIESTLTGFTFTVKEDAKATTITVTIGNPS